MIKAVLLDLDDTLIPTSEFAHTARRNAIRAMLQRGLAQKLTAFSYVKLEEKVYGLLLNIIKEKGSNFPHHFDVLLDRIAEKEKIQIKRNERDYLVAAAVRAYHATKNALQPYPDVIPILEELKNKYILAVVSEGIAKKQWEKLILTGLEHYFPPDRVFIAEQPEIKSPEFYSRILVQLKLKPVEAVMIGDKEQRDILPAKEIGMHTIKIMRTEREKDLRSKADVLLPDLLGIPLVLGKHNPIP